MKLLVLHSELGVLRGGGENFTRNLFGAMAKRGYDVTAAFVASPLGRYPFALPEGIKATPIRGWWARKPAQSVLSFVARFLPEHTRVGRVWRRVMDSLDWRSARWHDNRFQKRIRKCFAYRWSEFDAVYVHSSLPQAAEVSKYRPTILRLPGPAASEEVPLLRQVPVVCANGDVLLRLRSLIGEDAVELPVGLDARIFSPEGPSVRTAFGWTSEHRVIGYVGRLTRLKGVDVLAQAFHELANAVPEARLLIVGAGEEEQALRHVLKQEILEGKVRVVPVRDPESLGACYRAIDVFVLPSRYENFSNALLEAAACGVPFIAADVGGNRIIQQIACGSLFAPGSAADLLLQMRESLADLQSRRNRALAVSQLVRDTYDWDASADRLEAILETRVVGTAIQDDAGMAVGKPITV